MKLLFPALLILFIAFKLAHIIAWSWWWVLAPLWAPVAVYVVFASPWWIYTAWFESEEDKRLRIARETLKAYADALSRK